MSSTTNSTRYLGSTRVKKSSLNKTRVAEHAVHNTPLCTSIDNFYLTDFICENSAIMAKVSKTSRANKRLKRTSIYN